METFIKAAHVIQEELEANGYDVEVGVNRITETIEVKINQHGNNNPNEILPPVIEPLENDETDRYSYTINDHERVNQFIDESYDTDQFEE